MTYVTEGERKHDNVLRRRYCTEKLGVEVFLKSCKQFKEREENLREFTKT